VKRTRRGTARSAFPSQVTSAGTKPPATSGQAPRDFARALSGAEEFREGRHIYAEVVPQRFTIPTDGDEPEKNWWLQWTRDHFPSYEAFWVERIVPLTYRVKQRGDVRFKTAAELAAAGYTDEDVTLAQLHYTLLTHLGRVFELLDNARAFTSPVPVANAFGRYQFFETFTRLSGASDVADELLARRADPGKYAAWDERQGQRARTDWRAANPDPLKPVRSYRNRLVHGRVVPEVYVDATERSGPPGRPDPALPAVERGRQVPRLADRIQ
jgi:hypothetical protein